MLKKIISSRRKIDRGHVVELLVGRPARDDCSARLPNLLLTRECADGLSQLPETCGVCVHRGMVPVVRDGVNSRKEWMQTAMTTNDFF